MNKPIRLSRTTVMWTLGLAQILREHLGIKVAEAECWTFTKTAEWEACGNPGHCNRHGSGDPEDERDWMPCYEYYLSVYLGSGYLHEIGHRGERTEIRCRITKCRCDAGGHYYHQEVWVNHSLHGARRGFFGLLDDGSPYQIDDRTIPADPPRKIAFWRTEEAA